jgi:hypothetical protein
MGGGKKGGKYERKEQKEQKALTVLLSGLKKSSCNATLAI